MRDIYRPFAYLMAANFEALALIIGGWYGAEWLEENYPQSFSWLLVTMIAAILLIAKSWYQLFKVLTQDNDKKAEDN